MISLIRLPKSDIEERQRLQQSLMPEGMEKDLPPQDMADLIGYIAGFRAPPAP